MAREFPVRTDRIVETSTVDVAGLRSVIARAKKGWSEQLSRGLDTDTVVRDTDEQGYQRDAPLGVRFAQGLHHGTDHRSQISTALTLLGVEPPGIDVWEYGNDTGRVTDTPPPS